MVVAAPATLEEGRVMLVGNESDILHSAFNFPISEDGKRYPSADHYAHAQILTQLGLDEVHILALLATSSVNVSKKARELLQENMPSGHTMSSLAQYLTVSRQSYTMMGLRLRAEQDKRFRQTLTETGDALLIVCDRRDAELGIGMDDEAFVQFARRRMANAERISAWMHDERLRPKELGQNQLGFFLMWLRHELREKEKAKWLSTVEIKVDGLSLDDEEKPVQILVSDFVLALQGPFQPLSNYYAHTFELKGCFYRSVEHYAYQRLFEALRLSEEEIMKIRTTVKPVDVAKLAGRVFAKLELDSAEVEHKSARLDRWRQSAMKHKITKNDYFQKLLLSTGHALLIETTAEADPHWACGTDEFEFQHLLTKKYVTPQLLVDWQCGRQKLPFSLAHLGSNKVGLILMELRAKLAGNSTHRMPLIAPLTSSVLRSSVSNNMICFSPESVLHPFYPSEIRLNENTIFPSATHMAAQMGIKFLNVNAGDAAWIMEARDGPECWERFHTVICQQMQLPLEKIQQWYMEERQIALKEAMKLHFDQNPALLRVLLDTQDALLVSCARFSSVEAELNVGMRERDLRLWLSQVHQDSKQLMDLCLRPMAFRPPYFGGNRLGLMLMELRREFILAGVFPQTLPEFGQSVDAVLGSESPMENYVATLPFDVLDEANFQALWANPYLLMLKQQIESAPSDAVDVLVEQMEKAAMSKKQAPLLISRDEPQIATIFERLFLQESADNGPLENGGGAQVNCGDGPEVGLKQLEECSPEMLRSVYIKMAAQFRLKLAEMEEMQREIGFRSRDSNRLQELRRSLDRNREALNKATPRQNWPQMGSEEPKQAAARLGGVQARRGWGCSSDPRDNNSNSSVHRFRQFFRRIPLHPISQSNPNQDQHDRDYRSNLPWHQTAQAQAVQATQAQAVQAQIQAVQAAQAQAVQAQIQAVQAAQSQAVQAQIQAVQAAQAQAVQAQIQAVQAAQSQAVQAQIQAVQAAQAQAVQAQIQAVQAAQSQAVQAQIQAVQAAQAQAVQAQVLKAIHGEQAKEVQAVQATENPSKAQIQAVQAAEHDHDYRQTNFNLTWHQTAQVQAVQTAQVQAVQATENPSMARIGESLLDLLMPPPASPPPSMATELATTPTPIIPLDNLLEASGGNGAANAGQAVQQQQLQIQAIGQQTDSISAQPASQQLSAQWTQAAAISAERAQTPPTIGQMPPPPLMPIPRPEMTAPPKIPSLLGQPALAPPNFATQARPSLPPQISTTHPSYGSGGRRAPEHSVSYPDARRPPGRWEQQQQRAPQSRRGGRAGGGGRRADQWSGNYHGMSPPRRHRSRTPPRQRPSGGGPAAQASTSSTRTAVPTTTAATAPPAVKKPKRVVDESELSEGEILSDEDE